MLCSYDREIKFESCLSFNTGFERNYMKKLGSEESTHVVISFSMFSFARWSFFMKLMRPPPLLL